MSVSTHLPKNLESTERSPSLGTWSWVLAVILLLTTLPQPTGLARLPIAGLLKDHLHLSQGVVASFFFLSNPWYLKPFVGVVMDKWPLFGSRRRNYLLLFLVLAFLSWAILVAAPHTYNVLLVSCLLISVLTLVIATAVGALLVEVGQKFDASGRISGARSIVMSLCVIVSGPIGGTLATGSFSVAVAVNALLVLLALPVAFLWVREVSNSSTQNREDTTDRFGTAIASRPLWITLAMLAFFYFAPGFNTPLLFRQLDLFRLTMPQVGGLQSVGGVTGLVAALIYFPFCRKFPLGLVIALSMACYAAGNFSYLLYSSDLFKDGFIEAQNGFFYTLCELSLLDLAIRAAPKSFEGFGFGLVMSLRVAALLGADVLGSKLADQHLDFSKLVALNSGSTLLVIVILFLLPKQILVAKEGLASSGS